MPGRRGGGTSSGGLEVYAQSTRPTTTSQALWFVTDAARNPTGEIYVQIPPPAPPAAPTSLAATAASATQINLTWTDNSSDETAFSLQRSTSSSFASPTTISLAANATSYSDTGLTGSTTYYYRLRAVRTTSNSDWSASASASTPAAPFDMLALSPMGWWKADALGLADGAAVTSWTDSSGNSHPLTDNSVTANRPTFHTSVQNGLAGIHFDGVNDLLLVLGSPAWSAMSQPVTVAMVINHEAGQGIFDGVSNRFAFGINLGVANHMEVYGGSGAMGAAQSSPAGLGLWVAVFNGASSVIRKDRAVFANANTNIGTNTLPRPQIGSFSGAGSLFQGYFHELAVLPGQPDPTGVENYLRTRWGTP